MILTGSIIVVLVAALLAVVLFTPALRITTITFDGNKLASSDAVARALEPLKGRSLVDVSDDDVNALLADLAPVHGADAAAMPPSTLHVTVHEYVPVAVLQEAGRFVLIDENGRRLGTAKDRTAAKLPLIEGGAEAVNSEVFSSITSVLSALPESLLAELGHASADSVDSIQLKLLDGRSVFWGSAERNAAKASVLQALLNAPENGPPAQEVFDVSTPERPVVRSSS